MIMSVKARIMVIITTTKSGVITIIIEIKMTITGIGAIEETEKEAMEVESSVSRGKISREIRIRILISACTISMIIDFTNT